MDLRSIFLFLGSAFLYSFGNVALLMVLLELVTSGIVVVFSMVLIEIVVIRSESLSVELLCIGVTVSSIVAELSIT